jgi:hypothetical protein
MNYAPEVLSVNRIVQRPRPAPVPKLLVEWEPRLRVFFSNLADLLLRRQLPQVVITSRPGRFWSDVFVPTGSAWTSFAEVLLCQLLLIVLFVWGQSRVWVAVKLFPTHDSAPQSITYYPPKPTFSAVESRAANPKPRAAAKQAAAHRTARTPAMPVTPQQKPSMVTPPDIKQALAKPPDLQGSHSVTPMVPFSATAGPRRNTLVGPSGVVAPQPQVDQTTARRMAALQASAVAPAPDLAGSSLGRDLKAPNTSAVKVVPPPPTVQAGNSGRAGSLSSLSSSSLSNAGPNIVPPAPSVQDTDNTSGTGRLSALTGARPNVVPPAPSVQRAGVGTGRTPLGSVDGTGTAVVPPPPSVQNSAGSGRVKSLASGGPGVVPPPPSVQSAGNNGASARRGSMDTGSQVVPPAPSVQGSGGGTRFGSLSGSRSDVVPPPPSVDREGGNGRLGSLSGDGSQVAPPPAAVANGGSTSTAGKVLEPMDPLPIEGASSASAGNGNSNASVEELPLGLLGVVFAAPGTSFFSNFEVFVAKRRVGKDVQLIKLVYEFLPYQRRLSEYDLNNLPPRVIKLKVTADPTCDESLGQMIASHTDQAHPGENAKLPAALLSSDLNAVLPCYRTTATEFQKAMSRGR